jgi:hypothetical protein
MEFGIGELVRHFEEHFGKLPTRILLATAGMAIFGFSLHVVWETLIVPGYSIILWLISGSHLRSPTPAEVLSGIISWIISTALYVMGVAVLNKWTNSKVDAVIDNAQKISTEIRKQVEEDEEKMRADRIEFVEWYVSLDVMKAVKRENEQRIRSGLQPIKFPSLIKPEAVARLMELADETAPTSPPVTSQSGNRDG